MSVYLDIEKQLGSFRLRVKLSSENEVLAMLGASGCGKSMTLKCIAGIEKPDRGKIIVDGKTLFDSEKHINLSPQNRHTGLMFQNYALFPNMTVIQNIRAGAKRERNAEKREGLTEAIIDSFGLKGLVGHYPNQLSGGQQQRAALARILVSSPDILLLDEPFSALDSHLRFRLEREVRKVLTEFGKSVILVSHDRDEVFRLADKIAVISAGAVECFGSKSEVFANPGTKNAAMLTGCKNISKIEHIDDNYVLASDWGVELKIEDYGEKAVYAGIRMHDICPGDGENAFTCRVVEEIENPFSYTIMLSAGENSDLFGWETDKITWSKFRGKQIKIHMPPEKIVLLKG